MSLRKGVRVQFIGGDSFYGQMAYARRSTPRGERFVVDPQRANFYKYPDEGVVYKRAGIGEWWVEVDSKVGRPHKMYVYVCSSSDYITSGDERWHDHAEEKRRRNRARALAESSICSVDTLAAEFDVSREEVVDAVAGAFFSLIKSKGKPRWAL